MKYGLDVSTIGEYSHPQTLADLALGAEQAGWDGFFIWDTMTSSESPDQPIVDPWIALAAIVMKTSRIKIGALVTPLARRRPWKVARETISLDHLSNGRMIFGAGLGYSEKDFIDCGEEADPKKAAEMVQPFIEAGAT